MNFCGIELTGTQGAAIGSLAFAIASEVIGRSKLKENSVIDLALSIWGSRVKSIAPAHTPVASDRTVPSAASPAKPRRGRPPSSKTSSRTAPK